MDEITQKEKKDEISVIYKIFREIYSKAPPILKDLSSESIDNKYKESIDNYIDFKTIDKCFQEEEYCSITDVVKDMRLVFLNCYKFYGTKSDYTSKSLELEELLENQISCLNEYYKALADIKLTFKLLDVDGIPKSKVRYPKNCYDSKLLKFVAHCHPERLKKEYYKMVYSSTDEDNASISEELICWEKEMHFNDNYKYIGSMWELPEIGNFMAIIFKELNIDVVISQGEIEGMFLVPKESTTMGKVMTFLLMPIKKKGKFSDQIMPYKVWSKKLCNKLSEWYKMYHAKERNKVNVMNLLGIHPDFWTVVGDNNPLIKNNYCELSYFVKVWLVKGLCDHITKKYKTINDIILNCNERQCTIWKNDLETEEYFYFKSMSDLRIYYYFIPYDQPNLEFLESEKIEEDIKNTDVLSNSGVANIFCSNSRIQPNAKYFKIIADSVQGLRTFLDELDTEDSNVPDNLISALENFIKEIEPEEFNLVVLNNKSKIKLFKDWKSYSERYQNEEDEALKWEKKKLKPMSPVIKEEIITLEKRTRCVVPQKKCNPDYIFDFDECNSEIEEFRKVTDESSCDYSDSEDEWGAINQFKYNLTKQVSGLDELEKNVIKQRKLANNKQDKSTKLKINKKSIENVLVNEKLNILNSNNMDTEMKINYVSSVGDALLIDSKKEEANQILSVQKQKHKIVSCTKNNSIESIKNVEVISIDDDDEQIISDDEQIIIVDEQIISDDEQIISDAEQIISDDDDDVQFVGWTMKAQPSKTNESSSLKNNSKRSQNLISGKQIKNTNYFKPQVPPIKTNLPKLPPNISIMPANIHLSKEIQVTMVNKSPTTMPKYYNATKRAIEPKDYETNKYKTVNVKCKVITKSHYDGEAKFYIDLPNGTYHPVSDELMNKYLKEHNNRLPDYWMVPLSVELAKEYGFI